VNGIPLPELTQALEEYKRYEEAFRRASYYGSLCTSFLREQLQIAEKVLDELFISFYEMNIAPLWDASQRCFYGVSFCERQSVRSVKG